MNPDVESEGDPLLSSYCASCPSIEANRCLHSDISAHITGEQQKGEEEGGKGVIPFLKTSHLREEEELKK